MICRMEREPYVLALVVLAVLFVLAAIAASNPKVESPKYDGTEVESCEVDGPSAGDTTR